MKEPKQKEKRTKPEWPKLVKAPGITGITAKIYCYTRTKPDADGKEQKYPYYMLAYSLLGKRKQEAFADFDEAREAGVQAIKKIAGNEQQALELRNGDAFTYQRANELIAPFNITLETACSLVAEGLQALKGLGTIPEACREYAKRHSSITARVSVADAVQEMIEQAEREQEGKRKKAWIKLLRSHLQGDGKVVHALNCTVDAIEPSQINVYLGKLDCSERTKKNARDVLAHFFKWCRGRGYIPKDADPMANVQDYRDPACQPPQADAGRNPLAFRRAIPGSRLRLEPSALPGESPGDDQETNQVSGGPDRRPPSCPARGGSISPVEA